MEPLGLSNIAPCADALTGGIFMKRVFFICVAALAFAATPMLDASAMPIAKQQATLGHADSDIIQVRGHRGGRGHHYGWGRGRGHHYGWRHRR
jgi:hypothetical protein